MPRGAKAIIGEGEREGKLEGGAEGVGEVVVIRRQHELLLLQQQQQHQQQTQC